MFSMLMFMCRDPDDTMSKVSFQFSKKSLGGNLSRVLLQRLVFWYIVLVYTQIFQNSCVRGKEQLMLWLLSEVLITHWLSVKAR